MLINNFKSNMKNINIYIDYIINWNIIILKSQIEKEFFMNKEVIGQCPICNEKLYVSKLQCKSCGTSIEGDFNLCRFCQLSKEQKEFAEIFIKNRGNIKDIEKEMGISYPTVKNKLDSLINSLGYSTASTASKVDKLEILQRLNRGEISADEAIDLMNE